MSATDSQNFRGLQFATPLAVLLLSFPRKQLHGQQTPTISVEVRVVNVFATVRDKHGVIQPQLGKDDFILDEDGRPQPITYFAREADSPLTLGLLVDTSRSQRRVLGGEVTASEGFLNDMLHLDRDKAFVIHFDREVELLQDLTASRQKLEHALGLLNSPAPDDQGGWTREIGSRQHFGGTKLYDSIYLASEEVIKKQQGRKALIVLSDGVDHGSKENLVTAIESAQRADTAIYSIYFSSDEGFRDHGTIGYGGPGMGRHDGGERRPQQQDRPDGKKILERVSDETGGRLFEVSKKEPIDKIYGAIAEDLRNQYSIGYIPPADDANGYHRIHLATKQKDMAVQARGGYYAAK